ncbi:hypothetical protein BH23VER1_BH23VER1_03430 [soil metagenome]
MKAIRIRYLVTALCFVWAATASTVSAGWRDDPRFAKLAEEVADLGTVIRMVDTLVEMPADGSETLRRKLEKDVFARYSRGASPLVLADGLWLPGVIGLPGGEPAWPAATTARKDAYAALGRRLLVLPRLAGTAAASLHAMGELDSDEAFDALVASLSSPQSAGASTLRPQQVPPAVADPGLLAVRLAVERGRGPELARLWAPGSGVPQGVRLNGLWHLYSAAPSSFAAMAAAALASDPLAPDDVVEAARFHALPIGTLIESFTLAIGWETLRSGGDAWLTFILEHAEPEDEPALRELATMFFGHSRVGVLRNAWRETLRAGSEVAVRFPLLATDLVEFYLTPPEGAETPPDYDVITVAEFLAAATVRDESWKSLARKTVAFAKHLGDELGDAYDSEAAALFQLAVAVGDPADATAFATFLTPGLESPLRWVAYLAVHDRVGAALAAVHHSPARRLTNGWPGLDPVQVLRAATHLADEDSSQKPTLAAIALASASLRFARQDGDRLRARRKLETLTTRWDGLSHPDSHVLEVGLYHLLNDVGVPAESLVRALEAWSEANDLAELLASAPDSRQEAPWEDHYRRAVWSAYLNSTAAAQDLQTIRHLLSAAARSPDIDPAVETRLIRLEMLGCTSQVPAYPGLSDAYLSVRGWLLAWPASARDHVISPALWEAARAELAALGLDAQARGIVLDRFLAAHSGGRTRHPLAALATAVHLHATCSESEADMLGLSGSSIDSPFSYPWVTSELGTPQVTAEKLGDLLRDSPLREIWLALFLSQHLSDSGSLSILQRWLDDFARAGEGTWMHDLASAAASDPDDWFTTLFFPLSDPDLRAVLATAPHGLRCSLATHPGLGRWIDKHPTERAAVTRWAVSTIGEALVAVAGQSALRYFPRMEFGAVGGSLQQLLKTDPELVSELLDGLRTQLAKARQLAGERANFLNTLKGIDQWIERLEFDLDQPREGAESLPASARLLLYLEAGDQERARALLSAHGSDLTFERPPGSTTPWPEAARAAEAVARSLPPSAAGRRLYLRLLTAGRRIDRTSPRRSLSLTPEWVRLIREFDRTEFRDRTLRDRCLAHIIMDPMSGRYLPTTLEAWKTSIGKDWQDRMLEMLRANRVGASPSDTFAMVAAYGDLEAYRGDAPAVRKLLADLENALTNEPSHGQRNNSIGAEIRAASLRATIARAIIASFEESPPRPEMLELAHEMISGLASRKNRIDIAANLTIAARQDLAASILGLELAAGSGEETLRELVALASDRSPREHAAAERGGGTRYPIALTLRTLSAASTAQDVTPARRSALFAHAKTLYAATGEAAAPSHLLALLAGLLQPNEIRWQAKAAAERAADPAARQWALYDLARVYLELGITTAAARHADELAALQHSNPIPNAPNTGDLDRLIAGPAP